MQHFLRLALQGCLLAIAPTIVVLAQAPVITAVSPAANEHFASRTSPVQVTFSQPLTSGSSAALKVFSSQRGGLRTHNTPAVLSGNMLTFSPPAARPFLPGETVFSTITTTVASSNGNLAKARVMQFTTATRSAPGSFQPGSDALVGGSPQSVVVGDVDGDGDLDLITANSGGSTLSVRLNGGDATGSNTAFFSNGSTLFVGNQCYGATIGDVDGDGDLDLLAASYASSIVKVFLNGGDNTGTNTGFFTNTTSPSVGINPISVAVGDVDGDGDLDLLTANVSGTVSVRLNGGDATGSNTGLFSGSQNVLVGSGAYSVVVGDVDGDGDLDLLTANAGNGNGNTVSVRLNGGDNTGSNTGLFIGTQEVTVGINPQSVSLGDVDGDGDLDLVTANVGGGGGSTASVRLNGGDNTGSGMGQFSGTQAVVVSVNPQSVTLGDVDGDGDLDLLVAAGGSSSGRVNVRLNGGTGTPLPVELTAFTAEMTRGGTAIHLAWATASEKNSASFEVERSVDGMTFARLTTVAAAGNSSTPRFYRYSDTNLPIGASGLYYRLRQVDMDGTLVYSPVRTIMITSNFAAQILAYPNPAHDAVRIRLQSPSPMVPVEMYDALGRKIKSTPAPIAGTDAIISINDLSSGIYFIKYKSFTQKIQIK